MSSSDLNVSGKYCNVTYSIYGLHLFMAIRPAMLRVLPKPVWKSSSGLYHFQGIHNGNRTPMYRQQGLNEAQAKISTF